MISFDISFIPTNPLSFRYEEEINKRSGMEFTFTTLKKVGRETFLRSKYRKAVQVDKSSVGLIELLYRIEHFF